MIKTIFLIKHILMIKEEMIKILLKKNYLKGISLGIPLIVQLMKLKKLNLIIIINKKILFFLHFQIIIIMIYNFQIGQQEIKEKLILIIII